MTWIEWKEFFQLSTFIVYKNLQVILCAHSRETIIFFSTKVCERRETQSIFLYLLVVYIETKGAKKSLPMCCFCPYFVGFSLLFLHAMIKLIE